MSRISVLMTRLAELGHSPTFYKGDAVTDDTIEINKSVHIQLGRYYMNVVEMSGTENNSVFTFHEDTREIDQIINKIKTLCPLQESTLPK